MTKFTIISINYNNLEGLKRTLESVINQTWQEFEYIVIDGGSTDGSAEYIEGQSDKIDYWISEPDKGIYNAMNKGIARATGEYLFFLNSGDHLYDNFVFENYHQFLVEKDLIYFDIEVVDKKSSKIVSYPEDLSFSYFYFGTLCHQSTFIKKKLFEVIGMYDENLKLVSDWKFFILALFRFNCSYAKVNAILATYYLGGISSYLTNKERLYNERAEVLNLDFKNFMRDIKELKELRGLVSSFRKSRKIRLLVRLGLLNKF